jgi:hypothetical protein
MNKHNLLIKKVKKQILSINDLIESSFNKLKYFISNYKKIILNKDNRVFLGTGIAAILTLFYFLIPTLYNKNIIQSQIKNQILKNYNIKLKFNEKINYGLLPKPHFSAKNLSIFHGEKEIGMAKNFRIFIKAGKFFSINKIDIKDLVFIKTDFNINLNDGSFFKNLLKTEPNENKIQIKNSNIFFKNDNDEVLFINKIYNSKFYYDAQNLENILSSKNEIFNIPYKLVIKNDKFNKLVFSQFNSKKIRLSIENKIDYNELVKIGLLDILFVNKNASLNFEIKKNSLSFTSEDKKDLYKGLMYFKPFHLSANFNYDGLSSKYFFKDDTILVDLIKSEILNNSNLNLEINLNVKNIINVNELNNLILNFSIQQGNLNFSNSSIMWKKDMKIILTESLLNYDGEEINLIGKFVIKFQNPENFYSSFQVKKVHRKKIDQMQFDFVYNFDQKKISFDNVRVDNIQSNELDKYIDDFNKTDKGIFNKITFKNFVSNFFGIYAG